MSEHSTSCLRQLEAAMGEAVSEHHSLFSAKTVLSVVHVHECGPCASDPGAPLM